MALQQLSLGPTPVDAVPDAVTNGLDARPISSDGGDNGSKTPRLPRWTRQEILVLIQGKKVAETRVRGARAATLAFGSAQLEPKWASVSSYCKRHGVNRGPVQCRKRWSNLAGDFKKIKEWESQIRDDSESFWVMRNDLRRERKLPGFFDREVYDILESGSAPSPSPALALALAPAPAPPPVPALTSALNSDDAEPEHVFDSFKTAAADDGLFSDFEQDETSQSPIKEVPGKEAPVPTPDGEIPAPAPLSGTSNEREAAAAAAAAANPEIGSNLQEGRKRKRIAKEGEEESMMVQDELIGILEKNGKLLSAQLEAQNMNFQLDREQRRYHADGLVTVLNKVADALGRIADKL
ncbi:trihelix transcription factor ASR3-like isoform X2 [Cucurbita moschata]|uniref:Trihelix transcription factor ASR3-like isoform X2 n=1 Tax=Cucurbita moschata TaxID=3662 RepID=A0A6J1H617_CUCMO|nr:trihelix transcription factor ASR3-like isoform X2 [Cucurbita moschata]